MKRLITVIALCVMTFWGSYTLKAGDFGVVAGASFTSIREVSTDMATGFHAGVSYKFRLPLGFAVQPSVLYHMKSSLVEGAIADVTTFDYKMGYVEVPVSLQWGPDLLMFRPFVDVTPFVGYALNNEASGVKLQGEFMSKVQNKWEGVNRLEYGLGLGGGIEIWKLQLVCRYNWNFGDLFNADGGTADWNEIWNTATDSVKTGKNFGGVTLSLAFLF
ncbi:MAG: PorT family protein [Bacteroidales bacterium]|nr:PorT family protein [Bacteroidales bacterium]